MYVHVMQIMDPGLKPKTSSYKLEDNGAAKSLISLQLNAWHGFGCFLFSDTRKGNSQLCRRIIQKQAACLQRTSENHVVSISVQVNFYVCCLLLCTVWFQICCCGGVVGARGTKPK
ncbi:hypothetical protein AMECASPLE_038846 [Ameca splendens]|uniref:Uncharacterized protein n=1 Tax=Ameca splendens TaxID=208324 RepID=A0ABV0YJD6_9TELE